MKEGGPEEPGRAGGPPVFWVFKSGGHCLMLGSLEAGEDDDSAGAPTRALWWELGCWVQTP